MFDTKDRDELVDVLDSFQIAMFVADLTDDGDSIIMGRNRAFCRLHDVAPDQDVGLRLTQIHNSEDAAFANAANHKCAAEQAPIRVSRRMNYQVGRVEHQTSLVPVFDADGNVFRIIGNVVGQRVISGQHRLPSIVGEQTRLSVESLMLLPKAIRAIRFFIAEHWDVSAQDKMFLETFCQLCVEALDASRRLNVLLLQTVEAPAAQEYLLAEGDLSRTIREITDEV